ncbi:MULTISPECIES: phage tail protein [Bradyrhizobium]|uniref:phage tail protein n=1 Tax=Bradyrhizobium TaxID=374 RepID=UPI00067F2F73|nr:MULTISPECIES: tail fiber protein [Bradyrhizobium]PAY08931.1 phage tail protein [Bradyrhizobium sp. UFLA03-84]
MPQPFVGELKLFAGNFAPAGWQFCDGRLLPISDNEVLFNLIGTTYGGDGQSTFALPDLRGRLPLHMGNGFAIGETGGAETITLTTQQIPAHDHTMLACQNTGTSSNPQGNVLDQMGGALLLYKEQTPTTPLSPVVIGPAGGSQPHSNIQPYLCVNFIISLFGIFPSQS